MDKFTDMANLLAQIMVESSDVSSDFKVTDKSIEETATALRNSYGSYYQEVDGQMYYVGMIDDFGGHIQNEIDNNTKPNTP